MSQSFVHIFALSMILAACGGTKTVNSTALAELDADQVQGLRDQMEAADEAKADLASLHKQRDAVEAQYEDAQSSAEDADVAVDHTVDAKVDAVRAGDAQGTSELDATIAAAKSVSDTKQARADRLEAELELLEAKIDAKEIWVELTGARLELARAEAAADKGAEVDVSTFEEQVDKLQSDFDEEWSKVESLESEEA